MFNKLTLAAASAVLAIAANPSAADAEYSGPRARAERPVQRIAPPPPPRPEQRRPLRRNCRSGGGDTGSLLGAIAGGLLGRQMSSAPRGHRSGRDCR